MTEMLLQSNETFQNSKGLESYIIDLLPALPTAWPTGTITGLKARGGFELSLSWKNNKLTTGIIHSSLGASFKIRSPVPLKIQGLSLKQEFVNGYYTYKIESKNGKIYKISAE